MAARAPNTVNRWYGALAALELIVLACFITALDGTSPPRIKDNRSFELMLVAAPYLAGVALVLVCVIVGFEGLSRLSFVCFSFIQAGVAWAAYLGVGRGLIAPGKPSLLILAVGVGAFCASTLVLMVRGKPRQPRAVE